MKLILVVFVFLLLNGVVAQEKEFEFHDLRLIPPNSELLAKEDLISSKKFKGLSFNVPKHVEMFREGDVSIYNFDIGTCEYNLYRQNLGYGFKSEEELDQIYNWFLNVFTFSSKDSMSISEFTVDSLYGFKVLKARYNYKRDSKAFIKESFFLYLDEHINSFSVMKARNVECNEFYDFQEIINSIKILRPERSYQFKSKKAYFNRELYRYLIGTLSFIGLTAGLLYVIQRIF